MKPVAEVDGQIYLVSLHHSALFFPLRLNKFIANTGEEFGRVDFTEGRNDPGIVGYEISADLLPAVDFEALSVLNDKFEDSKVILTIYNLRDFEKVNGQHFVQRHVFSYSAFCKLKVGIPLEVKLEQRVKERVLAHVLI